MHEHTCSCTRRWGCCADTGATTASTRAPCCTLPPWGAADINSSAMPGRGFKCMTLYRLPSGPFLQDEGCLQAVRAPRKSEQSRSETVRSGLLGHIGRPCRVVVSRPCWGGCLERGLGLRRQSVPRKGQRRRPGVGVLWLGHEPGQGDFVGKMPVLLSGAQRGRLRAACRDRADRAGLAPPSLDQCPASRC